MQIFSKSYLNICNLLNINKIQRCNLLQRERPHFALQNTAFYKQLIIKALRSFTPTAAPNHLSSQLSVLNEDAGRPA